jgi:carboxyl-terminal processing protease
MIIKRLWPAIFFLLISYYAIGQPKTQYGNQAYVLIKMLEEYHYDPIELNDQTSADIFEKFLISLDPYRLYFTEKDLSQLKAYEKKIDDDILKKSDEFLVKTTRLFKQRLIETDTLIGTLLSKAFEYTENDTLVMIRKDTNYFKKELTDKSTKWKKWLKYQILYELFTPSVSVDSSFALTNQQLLANEPEARKKVRIKDKRNIKRILENPMGYENYIASLYLNAIATRYDPHTVFFTGNDKENFTSGLSPEGLSYGITFDESNDGGVYIQSLAPGGPAWKSNMLHPGDKLVKIKFPGGEAFDLSYSSLYEVESLLSASPSKKMEITVLKANGQENTVTLYKEKIRLDENLVKSYILKGDKIIGYISLPDFYTDWGSKKVNGCANDIAKEIIKLKKETIEGLILDIRFNGGGSMKEALNLAGIFIDEGPLSIYGSKNGKTTTEKDFNRGTIYTGPLLVMVNGFPEFYRIITGH